MVQLSPDSKSRPTQSKSAASLSSIAQATIFFGAIAGLLEGAGLLAFQRINYARWGPMIHVSKEILWISPIVDLIFFSLVSAAIWLVSRISSRIPANKIVIFTLTFLAGYDWLTLTGRLYHRACLLLAFGVAVAFSRWLARHEVQAARFFRKTAPWAIAAVALAFIGIQGGKWWHERTAVAALPQSAAGAPNVLVIVMDTLRADHVSAYGYPRPTTPNFDRLAQQGTLFENAVSPSSWSLPSHVSLVTGRYLHDHKVGDVQPEPWLGWGNSGLGGFPSIGEALEKNGYRTGAFSANRTYFAHNLGFARGFIHFEDYFSSPADTCLRTLYGREFARLYLNRTAKSKVTRALIFMGLQSLLDKDSEGSGSQGGAQAIRKRGAIVNDELLHWIDGEGDRPFLAFLNYFDAHVPYGAPGGYPPPPWKQNAVIDKYDDGIKYVDDCIGRLMLELQRRGLDQRTLVIITADHGESLGQHGLPFHGSALYWEQVHVPLLIWYPGHVPPGVTVDTPVTNASIPATIMTVLGQENTFPGPPLNALWTTPPVGIWPNPISEVSENKYLAQRDRPADPSVPTVVTGSMKSVVSGPWQLITHQRAGKQLYNWKLDPGETDNRIAAPDGKAISTAIESSGDKGTAPPLQP